MTSTIVAGWILAVAFNGSGANGHIFADQQSCENVRRFLDYGRECKCIPVNVHAIVPAHTNKK